MTLPAEALSLLGPSPEDRTADAEASRRVWAGAGHVAVVGPVPVVERELWVLRHPGMPLSVPVVVADGPGWFVAGEVAEVAASWTDAGVRAAAVDLARLHDVFVGAVPAVAPLRRPLTPAGLDGLLGAARAATVAAGLPTLLRDLLADPTPLVAVLAAQPETLLHGDPWPGNVRRPEAGVRVWVDWEHAAAGPAAADVASWLDQAPWSLPEGTTFDTDDHLAAYCAARTSLGDPAAFRRAVDAAGVLWFLGFDVPRLDAGDIDPGFAERVVDGRLAAAVRALS